MMSSVLLGLITTSRFIDKVFTMLCLGTTIDDSGMKTLAFSLCKAPRLTRLGPRPET